MQRLGIVVSTVLGSMAINALFFGQNESASAQYVTVGIIAAAAVAPVSFLCKLMFERAGPDEKQEIQNVRKRAKEEVERERAMSSTFADNVRVS